MATIFTNLETSLSWFHEGIVTVLMAVLGWAVRLESRLSTTQQQNEDVKDLISAKFDTVLTRFDNFDKRVGRVEDVLDVMRERNVKQDANQ